MKIDKKKIELIKIVFFDFDGVFTDNSVLVSEDGTESVICSREDGMGISLLKKINIKAYIISSEKNPVVSKRANKLNIKCFQNIDNKSKTIQEICSENRVQLSETIFVGNDINDIDALKIVGISIGVNDAHKDVIPYTDFITQRKGGKGAVREICDLLYNARNKNVY